MQKPSLPHDTILFIEGLDHEARGIGRSDGKVAFVEGALPGETVSVRYTRRKSHFDQAVTVQVLNPGPSRTTPRCAHFGVCGGCNMQHADPAAQIAFKQRILEDNLARIGRVKPDTLLPTLQGPAWGYRHFRAQCGQEGIGAGGLSRKGFQFCGGHAPLPHYGGTRGNSH